MPQPFSNKENIAPAKKPDRQWKFKKIAGSPGRKKFLGNYGNNKLTVANKKTHYSYNRHANNEEKSAILNMLECKVHH